MDGRPTMRARPMPRLGLALAVLILASLVATSVRSPSAHAAGPVRSREELSALPPAPGERGLTAHLLAPCCDTQTLEAHESEPAQALRMEIRGRLYAGETVEAVEASIIERYGERIRATPRHDPLRLVVAALLLTATLAGVALLRMLRRWRRAVPPPTAVTSPATVPAAAALPDTYDARLDAELADLD